MDYRKKLEQFNSTEKYRQEMAFMKCLANPVPGELIFDLGAGIGTLIDYLNKNTQAIVLGTDKETYGEKQPWYRDQIPSETDCLLMMHSIAHIDDIGAGLKRFKGTVIVITPNKDYLNQLDNEEYIPDPTVLQHYTMDKLKHLFSVCGYEILVCGQFGDQLNGCNERLFLKAVKI